MYQNNIYPPLPVPGQPPNQGTFPPPGTPTFFTNPQVSGRPISPPPFGAMPPPPQGFIPARRPISPPPFGAMPPPPQGFIPARRPISPVPMIFNGPPQPAMQLVQAQPAPQPKPAQPIHLIAAPPKPAPQLQFVAPSKPAAQPRFMVIGPPAAPATTPAPAPVPVPAPAGPAGENKYCFVFDKGQQLPSGPFTVQIAQETPETMAAAPAQSATNPMGWYNYPQQAQPQQPPSQQQPPPQQQWQWQIAQPAQLPQNPVSVQMQYGNPQPTCPAKPQPRQTGNRYGPREFREQPKRGRPKPQPISDDEDDDFWGF